MKQFIVKIAIFAAIMFLVDRIVGYAFNYFVQHTKGGYVGHHQYISNEMERDVLIFGSSRAVHHYDAKMIEDSLRLSCYNCGQDGNGAVFNEGQWKLITNRYQPKIIVYDVFPEFDLFKGDNHKYLGWLKLYYDHPGIPEVFDKIDKTERIKMCSQMYRYNYNPLQFIADFIHPIFKLDDYGYMPLSGDLDPMRVKKGNASSSSYSFDEQKINSLRAIIAERGTAKIVFVVSPIWYGMDEASLSPIISLCEENDIPFFDFSNNPKYYHQNKFFRDGLHMNQQGAEEFSRDLVSVLRQYK